MQKTNRTDEVDEQDEPDRMNGMNLVHFLPTAGWLLRFQRVGAAVFQRVVASVVVVVFVVESPRWKWIPNRQCATVHRNLPQEGQTKQSARLKHNGPAHEKNQLTHESEQVAWTKSPTSSRFKHTHLLWTCKQAFLVVREDHAPSCHDERNQHSHRASH